jgi:hypothetical protein
MGGNDLIWKNETKYQKHLTLIAQPSTPLIPQTIWANDSR